MIENVEEKIHIIVTYKIKIGNEEYLNCVEIVEKYLKEGGNKDKYIPEKVEPNGFKHPGYRSYEKVPPLKEHITICLTSLEYSFHNNGPQSS